MFSLEQYRAARTSAVVIDRSARGKIALTGSDRIPFLHALFTNDIAQLKKGAGVYSAYLTPQGRMISDMRVAETGDEIWLDVEESVAAPLAERLDKLIFAEDAHVKNVTNDFALFGVVGPAATQVIERATAVHVSSLTNQYDNLRQGALTIVRDDFLGVRGFDIYVDRGGAASLREKLLTAGAMAMSDATAEVLRVEAGRPKFGVDMDTDTIPLEAGIGDRAISLTKGCYVGQEVIVRVLHRGHGRVARRLVGLLLADSSPPLKGDAVLAGDKLVGEVRSAVTSPMMGGPIALAYVQRDHTSVGTDLIVKSSQGTFSARVHPLPFTGPADPAN
jgi:folate-binding protein YgfZ